MAKRKQSKVEDLVGQLIQSELESQLSRMVKKAKKRAVRESAKLKEFLQLPYVKDSEVIDAEVVELQLADGESSNPSIKKTSSFDG
jgi:DNA-directed RNA polymerase beta subunit